MGVGKNYKTQTKRRTHLARSKVKFTPVEKLYLVPEKNFAMIKNQIKTPMADFLNNLIELKITLFQGEKLQEWPSYIKLKIFLNKINPKKGFTQIMLHTPRYSI